MKQDWQFLSHRHFPRRGTNIFREASLIVRFNYSNQIQEQDRDLIRSRQKLLAQQTELRKHN